MLVAATIAVVVGLVVLAWSADKFVEGASAVASLLGMPTLLIGIVILGFGTSAPELVVSAFAAADGHTEIALGNALGSNIANIGLILGATVLILPIAVKSSTLKREFPFLLGATGLTWFLFLDGELSRLDAAILMASLVVFLGWSIWLASRRHDVELEEEVAEELHTQPRWRAWMWTIVGLILLVVSSRVLVWGSVEIAGALGWSDLVIGLTVVAIGTSAPELASSLAAARRGHADMVIGNVIGSNLFNTLGVIGLAGLIAPSVVDAEVLNRDMPVTLAFTVALFLIALLGGRNPMVKRWHGALLLGAWVAYTAYLLVVAS